jgi:NNP family nitrate/nitrite transporter-like MFS transporter
MKKTRNMTLVVVALVFVGMFLGNYGQYQLAAVPSMVYQQFNLTDVQFSSIMTAPMLPAIFLSIILGILVDKFGIKVMVGICYACAMAGFILRVFATDYSMMFIGMMLTGIGCAVLNSNLSKIVASLYPMEKIGTVVGILMAGSTGSMAVAYGTTAFFPSLEAAFWVTAVVSVVMTVAWLILVREADFHQLENGMPQDSTPVMEAITTSLKSKNIWLMGLSLMLLLGGATVISNFQVAYLTGIKGYDELVAGSFGTVLMIGSLLGSIFVPVFVTKSNKPGLLLGGIGLLAAVSVLGMVMLPTGGIYVASFLNGFLRSGIISVMMSLPVMFKEIGPKYAGTAGGLTVTLELIGAVLIPTYVVIPLTGGNMTAYFYVAAILIAASAVLAYALTRNVQFKQTAPADSESDRAA